jgi:hypothetical protein
MNILNPSIIFLKCLFENCFIIWKQFSQRIQQNSIENNGKKDHLDNGSSEDFLEFELIEEKKRIDQFDKKRLLLDCHV